MLAPSLRSNSTAACGGRARHGGLAGSVSGPAVAAAAAAGGNSPVGRRMWTAVPAGGSVPAPPDGGGLRPAVRYASLRSSVRASPSGRFAPSPFRLLAGGGGSSPGCSSPSPGWSHRCAPLRGFWRPRHPLRLPCSPPLLTNPKPSVHNLHDDLPTLRKSVPAGRRCTGSDAGDLP